MEQTFLFAEYEHLKLGPYDDFKTYKVHDNPNISILQRLYYYYT